MRERFLSTNQRRFPEGPHYYRLHWAGDIFSSGYALALKTAAQQFPDITFWTYTRSFEEAEPLLELPNMTTYASIDACNKNINLRPAFKRCHLASKKPEGRFVSCPVDEGRMPLEGACHKCRLCLKGKPVWFKTRH